MAYSVSKSNSIQFKVGDEKLAFAVVPDDFGYIFGLFKNTDAQGWICPVFGEENGAFDWNLTNETIMTHGSVSAFMLAQFPVMQAKLSRYVGAALVKPDEKNKPACVGYDLALDVAFDPVTLSFKLNKEPPLSHAR